jgi:beta-xylosidase
VVGLPAHASDRAAVSAIERDFADPFVAVDGAAYYALATGSRGKHVQVARSTDLTAWDDLPDALPMLPEWASQESPVKYTWAPSALRRQLGWVLYYTTRDRETGFQCISRGRAALPQGPYHDDSSRPFVCQDALCGSIDPSPFVDDVGRAWLLWKSDENSERCRGASRIWSQPLSEDGLGLESSATALLTVDRAWEQPLIEGPSMLRSGGSTYLFYSANRYESASYAIGFAKCDGPGGPCTKASVDSPFVKTLGALLGPGGQEFFRDQRGAMWMAFHAWTAPRSTYADGGARSLRLAPITFESGEPVVHL